MKPAFLTYTILWIMACSVALFLMVKQRHSLELFQSGYRAFILQPWKLVTFLIATFVFVVMAPYTGDPTWDYFDAGYMSVLTYLTAPWAVGILYRTFRFKTEWPKLYIAICLWFFTASWSYDLYIYLRDGFYPETWLPNIFASSFLYLSAGLMWNLEWYEQDGVTFGFLHSEWFKKGKQIQAVKLLLFALPLMALVGGLTLIFLL